MINSNKLPRVYWNELYTERMLAVAFFAKYGEIDLYGTGWDEPSWQLGRTHVPYTLTRLHRLALTHWQKIKPDPLLQAARSVYRGKTESKSNTLGNYTFALSFENIVLKGWITEKLFDCFFAGTIPVYLGAPDIQDYVPQDCFIDMRRFSGYENLRQYLKSLSDEDIRGYKERARAYLQSPQFRPFTKEAFAELFANLVETDTGLQLQ
jgi:hypothetical protein